MGITVEREVFHFCASSSSDDEPRGGPATAPTALDCVWTSRGSVTRPARHRGSARWGGRPFKFSQRTQSRSRTFGRTSRRRSSPSGGRAASRHPAPHRSLDALEVDGHRSTGLRARRPGQGRVRHRVEGRAELRRRGRGDGLRTPRALGSIRQGRAEPGRGDHAHDRPVVGQERLRSRVSPGPVSTILKL